MICTQTKSFILIKKTKSNIRIIFKSIFYIFFNILTLKINLKNKNYFNIFLNKKYFEKQPLI